MKFTANPRWGTNVAGLVIAALSPCLLTIETPSQYWHERHRLFLFALAAGIVMTAIYRRVMVEPNSITVVDGLWPFRFPRKMPLAAMNGVSVNAYWMKGGTAYEVSVLWTDMRGRNRSTLFTKGDYHAVERARDLARGLDLPLKLTPGFVKDAGEEARKTVQGCLPESSPAVNPP
jgi:hypothetical protein